MIRLIVTALLIGSFPAASQAWWNRDWAYRKEITLQSVPELKQLAGEPSVLVRLHSGNFGYFFDIREGGADLRFLAGDDATPLKYHVEKLDPLNGMALIWVKLPPSSRDRIYMYYGNPAAPPAADPAGSFDTATVLAMHFSSNPPRDLSQYDNQPIAVDGVSPLAASLLGAGIRLDGGGLSFAATPSLQPDPQRGLTLSAWIKPDDPKQDAVLFAFGEGARRLLLKLGAGGPVLTLVTDRGEVEAAATAPLAPGWHHLAAVLAPDALRLYVDGGEVAVRTLDGPVGIAGGLRVGDDGTGASPYHGALDELRVANVARGAAWLKLRYLDEGPGSGLLDYGEDQDQQGAEGSGEGGQDESASYFNVILQNVTVDGWVVIILLGIMGAISLMVMFFKWLHLGRVRRATRRFLHAYAGLEPDSDGMHSLLEQERRLRGSPLYALYAVCMREVDKRVGRAAGAQASGIDARGMVAIRAALDGVTVRQSQKINARMVLLTIAISGGPFLGLLGTVVGVMITFAAIAATGDVNINAIAPGIAAALVATVAGLAVAIPSLFAYNYLGSQIKDVLAEMRVFTDELLGRIGEIYGT